MKLLFLNGPNLNMLGIREPEIYGRRTYADLEAYIGDFCGELGIAYEIKQSNYEGGLVDAIQSAYGRMDGIVINPAAYTHTSVAVHLSKVSEREDFRQISYAGMACVQTYAGYGFQGYRMAAEFLLERAKD